MTRTKDQISLVLDDGVRIAVAGRIAETLSLLVRRGGKGVVAFDFPGGPAFRLAAYVHSLRKLGLAIETMREPHNGGLHGRYVLLSKLKEFKPAREGAEK